MADLKPVYQAATRHLAETALLNLSENWGSTYAVAARSWKQNWPELSALNKTVFPTDEALRKAFYLAHRDIATKWTMPITHWPNILNQLVIYFVGRIQI